MDRQGIPMEPRIFNPGATSDNTQLSLGLSFPICKWEVDGLGTFWGPRLWSRHLPNYQTAGITAPLGGAG